MPISKHKRALIIGSSCGVGVAIVSRLASEGADVVFTYSLFVCSSQREVN